MSDSPDSEPQSPSPLNSPLESPLDGELSNPVARDFAASASPMVLPSTGNPAVPTRLPSLRTTSETRPAANMTSSSTPLGSLAAARRPQASSPRVSALPSSMQDKLRAFQLSRQGTPVNPSASGLSSPISAGAAPSGPILGSPVSANPGGIPTSGALVGSPGGLRLPPGIGRPHPVNSASAPAVPAFKPKMSGGLAAKRGLNRGMKLSDIGGSGNTSPATDAGGNPSTTNGSSALPTDNAFAKYANLVDTATGTLNFQGKATLHGSGVDFAGGSSFSISLDEVDTLAELGKGNYGTVYKVRHSRPRIRVPGQGLAGNKLPSSLAARSTSDVTGEAASGGAGAATTGSGEIMAMKELRLELEDAKFAAILMELDVLHKCVSPFVIDFYGAFFQEGAVYICMEFMDGGSIDKLYANGMPENVLRKIALSTVMGLKTLKDDHNIIHRDVKPTNILINTRGQVKICDFGVSGNLVASIAKTNIGCQSYMAPERISSGGVAQAGANPGGGTYSVQSDVWSLGLSLIECAMGRYPYPPETYNNIFSQLSAIVDGDPPGLPDEGYSEQARAFVRACLHKVPKLRPTYAMLMRHPWLAPLMQPPSVSEDADAEAAAEAGADMSKDGTDASVVTGAAAVALAVASGSSGGPAAAPGSMPDTSDPEVAAWVMQALEMRRQGKLKGAQKPALHAAPLDAVASSSPGSVQPVAMTAES